MNQTGFIPVFTPSQASTDDLEKIFVQRHELLRDAEDRVRESATTGNKHHLLFVGPRGSGKTHFVSLLIHRLGSDRTLDDKLDIAWLNEDETCTNFLDLLIKIFEALAKRYPDRYDIDYLESVYENDNLTEAGASMQSHLLEPLKDRTCLIVVENLDLLFQSIGDEGQKKLRAFLQEQSVFTFAATAQALSDDLTDRQLPFFGFFQTDHLKPLQLSDAIALIGKIADKNGDNKLKAFLATPKGRSRVRALHFLSGGNHRVFLVLSQFINRENIEDLVVPFQKMVDEMTPYYQERIRALPPLQRKIVELLCKSSETVPVKNIAKRMVGSTHQTVSKQLQELRSKGYVRSHFRGRESLYEVSEPLMRICVEVKENQNYGPLRLIVDFIRIWYEANELERFRNSSVKGSIEFSYYDSACERTMSEGNLRQKILATDLQFRLKDSVLEKNLGGLKADFDSTSEDLLLAVECLIDGNKEECVSLISSMKGAVEPSDLLLRGILFAEIGETNKATMDFSTVVSMKTANTEFVAKALIFRGTIYSQNGELENATSDYSAVTTLEGATVDYVSKALFCRGFTLGENGDIENEIADYSSIVTLEGAPIDLVAKALFNRGVTHDQNGDIEDAIRDHSAVITLEGATVEHVTRALFYRGCSHGENGDIEKEITDYSTIITLEGAPVEQVAKALFNRGLAYKSAGDFENEIADYSAIITLEDAPVEQVVKALTNRGLTHGENGDIEKEITDYSTIITLEGAPVEQVAKALFNRGLAYKSAGDFENEIADYSAIITLEDAPVDYVVKALTNRGFTLGENGNTEKEISDYSAAITLEGATFEHVGNALFNRGLSHCQNDDIESGIVDFSTIITLEGITVKQVADALFYRGVAHGKNSDIENAIADYSAVITLEGAPVELVAKALFNRGFSHGGNGDIENEIADYSAVITLEGAPVEQVADALLWRGVLRSRLHSYEKALMDLKALLKTEGVSTEAVSNAHLGIGELKARKGEWQETLSCLNSALQKGKEATPRYVCDLGELLEILYEAGLSEQAMGEIVRQLLEIASSNEVLGELGEHLVKHLAVISIAAAKFDPLWLNRWAEIWGSAIEGIPELSITKRMLRYGTEFLCSKDRDESILNHLNSEERTLLRETLGLD